MSVIFDGVEVPIPQTQAIDIGLVTRESLLLSGALRVKQSTEYHEFPTFSCVGTSSEYSALLGEIGTRGSLMINSTTASYTNCYIRSIGPITKNPMTTTYSFNIGFVQDTST